MFSRFFGKRDKSADVPTKEAQSTRWPETPDSRLPKATPSATRAMSRALPPVRSESHASPVSPPVPAVPAPVRVAPLVPDFPADHQIDFVLPTAPVPLDAEPTLEQRKNTALATVEQHHQRIANTIRTLWGYRECSVYINRLIMAGGDGMGHARVGFNQEAVAAMLALSDIHDAEFGPPSTLGGGLGLI